MLDRNARVGCAPRLPLFGITITMDFDDHDRRISTRDTVFVPLVL